MDAVAAPSPHLWSRIPTQGMVQVFCPQYTVKIGSQVVLQACLLCFSSLSSTVNPAWTMLIVGPSGVIELYTYTKFSKFNSQGPLSVSSIPSVAPSLW